MTDRPGPPTGQLAGPASRSQPSLARRTLMAQARAELLMTLRRGESVLLALGIPVILLGFFTLIGYPDKATTNGLDTIDFLAPGVLALAVMSTAMVGLGIATGFERQYGVLKRLGATPLGRPSLLAAKTIAIAGVEVVQIVVLATVAWALGWHAEGDVLVVIVVMALATVAFAGLGLLMAGSLTAEMTLAGANGLYLVFLLLGGMVVPLSRLPGPVRALARILPGAALSDALHAVLGTGSHVPSRAWLVLLIWALAAPAAAALTFRWE
jgi:ABC-2 type transport system permease protein